MFPYCFQIKSFLRVISYLICEGCESSRQVAISLGMLLVLKTGAMYTIGPFTVASTVPIMLVHWMLDFIHCLFVP